jgi:hypothetical protein
LAEVVSLGDAQRHVDADLLQLRFQALGDIGVVGRGWPGWMSSTRGKRRAFRAALEAGFVEQLVGLVEVQLRKGSTWSAVEGAGRRDRAGGGLC